MKASSETTEKWVQQIIVGNPSVLGLGDLDVKEVERRQPHAGRLDLLLVDPDSSTRYEVELQLGATDESHIIDMRRTYTEPQVRAPVRKQRAGLAPLELPPSS